MTYVITVFKQYTMQDDKEMTLTYKNIDSEQFEDIKRGWQDAGYVVMKG